MSLGPLLFRADLRAEKKGDTQVEGDLGIAPIAAALMIQVEGDLHRYKGAADNLSKIHVGTKAFKTLANYRSFCAVLF